MLFPQKTYNSIKTSNKSQLKAILPNTWPVLLKIVNMMEKKEKNKESLINFQSQE